MIGNTCRVSDREAQKCVTNVTFKVENYFAGRRRAVVGFGTLFRYREMRLATAPVRLMQ